MRERSGPLRHAIYRHVIFAPKDWQKTLELGRMGERLPILVTVGSAHSDCPNTEGLEPVERNASVLERRIAPVVDRREATLLNLVVGLAP